MKLFAISALALSATAAFAQQPDCRTMQAPVGTECVFTGTELPVQRYLGDITLPSSDHVRMTGPLGTGVIAAAVAGPRISVGILGGVQAETFGGFTSGVLRTLGGKAYARIEFNRTLGVEVRGTSIAIDGSNHTEAIEAGPRVAHSFGPMRVYAEALAGAGYEYTWNLPVSGVVGLAVAVPHTHFSIIPFDGTYRYATLQNSTSTANPRRGRIEAFGGVEYHFGSLR